MNTVTKGVNGAVFLGPAIRRSLAITTTSLLHALEGGSLHVNEISTRGSQLIQLRQVTQTHVRANSPLRDYSHDSKDDQSVEDQLLSANTTGPRRFFQVCDGHRSITIDKQFSIVRRSQTTLRFFVGGDDYRRLMQYGVRSEGGATNGRARGVPTRVTRIGSGRIRFVAFHRCLTTFRGLFYVRLQVVYLRRDREPRLV